MMIRNILLVVLSLLSTTGRALSGVYCQNPYCTFDRELKNDKGEKKKISYSFKYRAAQLGEPTVIVIPGGPGGTSTNADFNEYGFPDSFGVILTDPRFVGENSKVLYQEFTNAMTTQGVADDIALTVRKLELKNYILYGQSYGTVVATVAAAQLKDNPPRTVVLDGTMGRATKSDEYIMGFEKRWAEVSRSIPHDLLTKFEKRVQEMRQQYDFKDDDVFTMIQIPLMMQSRVRGTDDLDEFLNVVTLQPLNTVVSVMQHTISAMNGSPDEMLFHAWVACNEVFIEGDPKGTPFSLGSIKGNTLLTTLGSCSQFSRNPTKYYDAGHFQVKAPLFYIQGEKDPATPTWQAEYHFKSQKNSALKRLIIVPNGGHISVADAADKCVQIFWASLAGDLNQVESSFRSCLAPKN